MYVIQKRFMPFPAFLGVFREILSIFSGFSIASLKRITSVYVFHPSQKEKDLFFQSLGWGSGSPKKAVFTLKIQKFVLRHENDMLSISRSFQTYITFIFLTVDEISLN